MDQSDILHAFREVSQEKDSSRDIRVREFDQIVWTSGQKRSSKRRALFRKSKKNSELTQNWCCQSFHAEGYTKEI
jgi:hypothetical protein